MRHLCDCAGDELGQPALVTSKTVNKRDQPLAS
jgi:hypothetical protein